MAYAAIPSMTRPDIGGEADEWAAPIRSTYLPDGPGPKGGGGSRWLNLSVCSILKDEAGNLPGLIACLPLSRIEWNVLDTGSRDATVAILEKAGITARPFKWIDDFSAARNASLALAQRDWILWLDGDDRLDEGFWEGLEALIQGPRRAYRFIVRSPRENSHGERFRQIRLFPNHMGIAFEGRIHEQLGTSLLRLDVPVAQADLEILHIGYDTAAKRGAKLARNRALLERERLDHPLDPTVILEYGNCLYQSEEYAAAKAAYLGLMPSPEPRNCKPAPDDEVLRHFPSLLGETCVRLEAKAEAAEWFRLAVSWNPSDIQPYYWLGKHALADGNIHGALEYFYAAVERPAMVGRVATDSHTVRRNALALVVLCESQLFGPDKAPRARQCLRDLIAGGLDPFPLDYRVPWDFLRAAGADADAERYARAYLGKFPAPSTDMAMWEDFLEFLFTAGRHADILEIFSARPYLVLASGVLEAFRAKSLEKAKRETGGIYEVYRAAVRKFPEDPTLLVYFSDFVNHNKLYARCYADLKALPRPSETVREFLRQMEAQGWGNGMGD